MTKYLLIAGMLAASSLAAHAQATVQDIDGDGAFSMEELQAAYPDLTNEIYSAVDANGDGTVDTDELADAMGSGLLGG